MSTIPSRIGDYVVERELEATSTEITYLGVHAILPRRAAVKVMHPAFTGLKAVAVQMMREACILEALRHPGVPRVYECGVLADRRPWIATEHIGGTALGTGAIPLSNVAAMLRDVADILDHAHRRGIVHRNLRPDAILACSDQRGISTCVAGWGDARIHDTTAPQLEPTDHLHYRAPELACGGDAFDGRADIYALGVIAHQAMAGQPPTGPIARACPGAPPRMCALVDRMLAFDPWERPTASDVRTQVIRLLEILAGIDDEVVEAEDVVLVDISRQPPPLPDRAKLRWTPTNLPRHAGAMPAVTPETSKRR
jgi:serine/threonine protein kinase